MLRSLFLKKWCRATVQTTACAVTVSSAMVLSTPAMAEWPGSVIVLGKDTTPTNPTLNLDTFTKAGFAKNADGSGYTITVPYGACAIEVASNGIIIPTENTIVVGKDKTLFIDFPDVDNTGLRMSAEAKNPYGLTIEGGLDIDARDGLLYWSDGIVYVSEQQDTSEDAEKIHLTVTEAMNVNVKDLDIEGYGYGVGITEGDFKVGSDGSKDFNLSMTGIHNRYQGEEVNLYALELGGGYDKVNVDRTYKFYGNLNINAVQFAFKANGSGVKQGDVYIYGVSLDTSADEKTGADTMTVDKALTIQDVSAGADASSSEAYGFYTSELGDSNAFVTVEQATEVSRIKATTNSGAGVCATGVRVDNVPQLIQTGVEKIENEDGTVTLKPIFASEAPNAGNVEITLKGGLTIQDVSASGGKDGGANEGADLAEAAEKAQADPEAENVQNVLTNPKAYGLAIYGLSVYEAYGKAYGQSVSEVKATQVSDATVTVEGATLISGISATTNNGKKSGAETYAAGIEVGTDDKHTATLNLNGDVTVEKVSASGGTVNDAYAVRAFNNATVNINAAASADKTVVVKGDLEKESLEEKMAQVSVDGSNAKVVMNLCNEKSDFYGYTTTGVNADASSTIDISLANDATWYVPWDNHLQGTLTMGNRGVVDMSAYRREGEPFKTLTVDKLTGKGGVFHMSVNTETAKADRLVIGNGTGEHYLSFQNTSENAGKEDILVVTQKSGNASFHQANEVVVGNYTYTLRTDTLADGSSLTFLTTAGQLAPSTLASLSMASLGAQCSAYLSSVGNLRSRLGEVRGRTARKGLWGQVNFWKDRADSFGGTSLSQDVMALSVGYDVMPNKKWIVGAAISAATHDQTGVECTGRVSGDANSFSVTPYGTWMHANGTYVDIVGSVGVYDQDFDLYRPGQAGVSSCYTDFGAGVSVEVGRKFVSRSRAPRAVDAKGVSVSTVRRPSHGWFVEPQAQLSFYAVFADDYTTNDGGTAKRDDAAFLTGRVGVVAGKDFTYKGTKKGQVYAKAGYIHEICGDQKVVFNGEEFSEDSILGSRFYYGIGADMELRGNLRAYGEIGREEGAHYTREYDVRCGIKYSY